jgi:hypothetical protein
LARPRHRNKDLEAVLREAERKGWRIVKRGKYYNMYCPCPSKHKKTVHCSPSNSDYEKNLRMQLKRATCWFGGTEGGDER